MSEIIVEARNILTQFGENIVHEELNFSVKKGEIVGLVGGSGTGKSVLLNTILGLKQPEGGEVYIHGQNRAEMKDSDRESLNNQLGALF